MINNNNYIQKRIKEFILKKLQYGIRCHLPKKYLDNFGFDVHMRNEVDNMVIMLTSFMFGKEQKKEIFFQTPKTWWEHFKLTNKWKWWFNWYVKRFPIKFGKHKYNVMKYTVFPKLQFPEDLKNKEKLIYYDEY